MKTELENVESLKQQLEDELAQGISFLHWITLALITGCISLGLCALSIVLLCLDNSYWFPTFIVSLLVFILSVYCKYMSDTNKPKGWR